MGSVPIFGCRVWKKKPKAFWERAYKGHVLWQGKQKLGKVTLAGGGPLHLGGLRRAGASDDLEKAKKAVELAVAMADKQLDLFR